MSATLPPNWDTVLVTAALDDDRPIIRPTVKTAARDYREQGAFPIVDQSQNAIAGWTDNAAAVLRPARPVVVFGDHTRAFKYVDFPFATGADGTLVLNPSAEFEPRFFYFACLGLEIPARGYNRHYTMLKEMAVPKPPLDEQRKMAAVLGKVQTAVAVEGDLVRVAQELKQAACRQLFTRGLRGERQKQTEIGLIPESWEVVPCEALCETITVGVVVKPASHYVPNGVPAFRSLNVRADRLETDRLVFFSEESNRTILSKSRLNSGDVLVVRTGYPGTSCVVPPEFDGANCIDLVLLRPNRSLVIPSFLSRFFNSDSGKSQALRSKTGLAQQHLNVNAVKTTRVPKPSKAEQQEIADLLATLDAKIAHHEARQALLRELFRTLLHDLLTARRRVTGLDLSALSS